MDTRIDKVGIVSSLAGTPMEFRALSEACVQFGAESHAGFTARCRAWLAAYRGIERFPDGSFVHVDEAGVATGRPILGPGSLYAERAAELALALARLAREARLFRDGTGSREHLTNAILAGEELL